MSHTPTTSRRIPSSGQGFGPLQMDLAVHGQPRKTVGSASGFVVGRTFGSAAGLPPALSFTSAHEASKNEPNTIPVSGGLSKGVAALRKFLKALNPGFRRSKMVRTSFKIPVVRTFTGKISEG